MEAKDLVKGRGDLIADSWYDDRTLKLMFEADYIQPSKNLHKSSLFLWIFRHAWSVAKIYKFIKKNSI